MNINGTILQNGYIPNENLYRKQITAQILRHSKYDNTEQNFDECFIHQKSFDFTWKTAAEEIHVLSKMHGQELLQRERFFNRNVIINMLIEYHNNSNHTDIDKCIKQLQKATDYSKIDHIFSKFTKCHKFENNMPKSNAWILAFKNSGAYYTMNNLIKFYNCNFYDKNNKPLTMQQSVIQLENNANTKSISLYPILVKFINDNYELINEKLFTSNKL